MYKRQPVHEDGHVIAVGVNAVCSFVLVQHLQAVVVNVLFIKQIDVLGCAVVPFEYLHMVVLYLAGLFNNTLVFVCKGIGKEPRPFGVGERIAIQRLKLTAQIINKPRLVRDAYVFISLPLKPLNKILLQLRFGLVKVIAPGAWRIFRNYGRFVVA